MSDIDWIIGVEQEAKGEEILESIDELLKLNCKHINTFYFNKTEMQSCNIIFNSGLKILKTIIQLNYHGNNHNFNS